MKLDMRPALGNRIPHPTEKEPLYALLWWEMTSGSEFVVQAWSPAGSEEAWVRLQGQ